MIPPPNTRFISRIPVSKRLVSFDSIDCIGMEWAGPFDFPADPPLRPESFPFEEDSIKLFHSPQSGQRPSHFGSLCPQLLHTYTVFVLAITDYSPGHIIDISDIL
jgi:hypothetical protein